MIKKRVSEVITTEEIKKWNKGDIITITAGTGVGKSYFIKNILYAFAKQENKKILFLIHRTDCKNQFYEEIKRDNKLDTIVIKTYQSIEYSIMYDKSIDFSEYKYIVCDEMHYFFSDSAFSKTTDISINIILDQKDNIRIFMSATGNYTKNYIKNVKKNDTIDYEIPINYSFIESLTFYNLDDTLEMFIEESVKSGEKAIFFIQSAKKAYELYSRHKDVCIFNCSKSNKEYYKYVDENIINEMLVNEKFDSNILITTTCMDAGVNIIDNKLKHIVCDVEDYNTIIQCIGRKRLQNENDKIYVYIKSVNNCVLGGKKGMLSSKMEMADYLREHTVEEYINKFKRKCDYSQIVYDEVVEEDDKCTKKINELMYFKCMIDICDIDTMLSYKKYGFNKFIAYKLGFYDDSQGFTYRIIEEQKKQDELEEYLETLVGKTLIKDEQKELINMIDLRDGRNRVQKSINIINSYLIENYNYSVSSKRIRIDGKQLRTWVVSKID